MQCERIVATCFCQTDGETRREISPEIFVIVAFKKLNSHMIDLWERRQCFHFRLNGSQFQPDSSCIFFLVVKHSWFKKVEILGVNNKGFYLVCNYDRWVSRERVFPPGSLFVWSPDPKREQRRICEWVHGE